MTLILFCIFTLVPKLRRVLQTNVYSKSLPNHLYNLFQQIGFFCLEKNNTKQSLFFFFFVFFKCCLFTYDEVVQ